MAKSSSKNKLVLLIKNKSIIFCEGNFNNSELKIDKLFIHHTEFEIYEQGKIVNEAMLAEEIKLAINKNKLRCKNAYLYILGNDLIKKTIIVPYLNNENDFNDLVEAEISQVLPLDFDNYIIKHKLISEDKRENSHKVKLNCAIISKEIVESYRRVLKLAKLKPVVLDIDVSAVENLVKYVIFSNSDSPSFYKRNVDNTSIVLAELNYTSCTLSVFKNGVLDFDRIVKSPQITPDFLKLLENAKNIDDINDEELFELFNELLSEINLVLKYYLTRDRENKIDEIFLLGDATRIKDLDLYVQHILQITTNSISSLNGIYDNRALNEPIGTLVSGIGGLIRW